MTTPDQTQPPKRGRPPKPDALVPLTVHVSRERKRWLDARNASEAVREALDARWPLDARKPRS